MTAVLRQVTWGKGLKVEVDDVHGGLKATVGAIASEFGDMLGTRNTFAKLFAVENPAELKEKDRYRAWVLLTTIGQDPADWGIGDDCVPPTPGVTRLRKRLPAALVRHQGLEPRTRWLTACSSETGSWGSYPFFAAA
jgi:hypothetical protein